MLAGVVGPCCVCYIGQCAQAQASQLTKRRAAGFGIRYSIPKISFSLFVMFSVSQMHQGHKLLFIYILYVILSLIGHVVQ
jgi:hypothetical protein